MKGADLQKLLVGIIPNWGPISIARPPLGSSSDAPWWSGIKWSAADWALGRRRSTLWLNT